MESLSSVSIAIMVPRSIDDRSSANLSGYVTASRPTQLLQLLTCLALEHQ